MTLHTTTKLPRISPIVPTARPAAFNDPAWQKKDAEGEIPCRLRFQVRQSGEAEKKLA
jgi:hypothetical protein